VRDIVVQYVADCPNLSVVLDRLAQAGETEAAITLYEVRPDEPTPDGFAGSPTVLIDGLNPLGPTGSDGSVSCTLRIPSVAQLRAALER
jgi:hypothetical protein